MSGVPQGGIGPLLAPLGLPWPRQGPTVNSHRFQPVDHSGPNPSQPRKGVDPAGSPCFGQTILAATLVGPVRAESLPDRFPWVPPTAIHGLPLRGIKERSNLFESHWSNQ